jgi:hypothetical protein
LPTPDMGQQNVRRHTEQQLERKKLGAQKPNFPLVSDVLGHPAAQ